MLSCEVYGRICDHNARRAVYDALCHFKYPHDDIPRIRDDKHSTGSLEYPLEEHPGIHVIRLFLSVMSWISSSVMTKARITPDYVGRMTLFDSVFIMLKMLLFHACGVEPT